MNKYITSCPKCGDPDCLRAEASIDLMIQYDGKYFSYEDDGNEPIANSWYCFACGETFTFEEVENHAIKLMKEAE